MNFSTKKQTNTMLKAIFFGILSSLFIQGFITVVDYYSNGYWVTPETRTFIAGTILSGIAFGGAWYSFLEYRKLKN